MGEQISNETGGVPHPRLDFIRHTTDCCYKNCLEYVPPEATVLDVGIGNGIMLENYHELIKSRQLRITDVDSNKSYVNHCSSLYRDRFRFMEFVKPKLKYVTTVDFGKVTDENEFFILLEDHKLPVLKTRRSEGNGSRGNIR